MRKIILLICIFTLNVFRLDAMSLNEVENYIPGNPVILECGAHNGRDTIRMSKKWPKGKIYAIEASPDIYKILVKRTSHLHNVQTFPIALGWEDAIVKFYISNSLSWPEKGQCSLLHTNPRYWAWPNIKLNQEVEVQMLTLDTWAEINNVENIDFMWLDMQGADFNMLMASSKILDTVKVIQCEISGKEFYKGSVLFNEGKRFLENRGFKLIEVIGKVHGNAWFVRKN